jgi:hypothetical protein
MSVRKGPDPSSFDLTHPCPLWVQDPAAINTTHRWSEHSVSMVQKVEGTVSRSDERLIAPIGLSAVDRRLLGTKPDLERKTCPV